MKLVGYLVILTATFGAVTLSAPIATPEPVPIAAPEPVPIAAPEPEPEPIAAPIEVTDFEKRAAEAIPDPIIEEFEKRDPVSFLGISLLIQTTNSLWFSVSKTVIGLLSNKI